MFNHRRQSWRRGTQCDCKCDWLWVRSPLEEMEYLFEFIYLFLRFIVGVEGVSRQWAALSSAAQHTMSLEFVRKWGTKCLNTLFPLPILLCAGYSVKLI